MAPKAPHGSAKRCSNSKSKGVNPPLHPGKFDVKAICFDVGVSCGEAAQVLGCLSYFEKVFTIVFGSLRNWIFMGAQIDPRKASHWGAEGAPWQREALSAAEGGAKRRPARPPEKR